MQNKKINFQNKSILMKGAGLIDFMNAELKNKNKISVKLPNDLLVNKKKNLCQWFVSVFLISLIPSCLS